MSKPTLARLQTPAHRDLLAIRTQAMVDDMLAAGVLVCVNRLSVLDRLRAAVPPSLRLTVTAEHRPEDLQTAADAVKAAAQRVLKL